MRSRRLEPMPLQYLYRECSLGSHSLFATYPHLDHLWQPRGLRRPLRQRSLWSSGRCNRALLLWIQHAHLPMSSITEGIPQHGEYCRCSGRLEANGCRRHGAHNRYAQITRQNPHGWAQLSRLDSPSKMACFIAQRTSRHLIR